MSMVRAFESVPWYLTSGCTVTASDPGMQYTTDFLAISCRSVSWLIWPSPFRQLSAKSYAKAGGQISASLPTSHHPLVTSKKITGPGISGGPAERPHRPRPPLRVHFIIRRRLRLMVGLQRKTLTARPVRVLVIFFNFGLAKNPCFGRAYTPPGERMSSIQLSPTKEFLLLGSRLYNSTPPWHVHSGL